MKMDFNKPTYLKVYPPIGGITAHATMPKRLEHSIISVFLQAFDSNEWYMKNGLLTGGLNLRPLSHEPALTTRPWLLALLKHFYLKD
jgi:hypothetical protein